MKQFFDELKPKVNKIYKKSKKELVRYTKRLHKEFKKYLNTNILFMSFVISSLINTSMLRFFTVKNYFDISPLIADLAVIVIIGAFGYFIKPKHQFKYYFSWSTLIVLLCIINSMYYKNYLSYASVSLLATSLQLIGVSDAVVENIMELKDFSFLWQIAAMLFVNYTLKKRDYYEKVSKIEIGKVRALNTIVVGLILVGFFISTLNSVDISRLGKQWNREYIVMKFGILTYQANDIIASLEPKISPLFGYDDAAKEFRDYYEENESVIKVNEYTNYLKDKNIIAIHAESIQNFLIGLEFNGVEVTPTLNKLAKEGVYFSNFYAQDSTGTSSDSEFTFNTGLMPASSGTVFISYFDREYVATPQLLKNLGYYTFSMHANNGTYWNREAMHKNLGYDKFFYYKKDYVIDEVIGLGLSDKSFFKQSVPKISEINDTYDKWYGLMIMLTNHTPFSDIVDKGIATYDVSMPYEVVDPETGEVTTEIAPYLEGTKLGNYIKSAHYADEALGEFIEQLDSEGLLDNTAIVLYGDHDAKLSRNEFIRMYNYDPTTKGILSSDDPNYIDFDEIDYELNRKVPFIIWMKDGNKTREVTEVMGMYNVANTLGNMLGFKNDYALGSDIFSIEPDTNLVVFPSGNWITNKMYYDATKETTRLLVQDASISVEEINANQLKAEEMISVSNNIIVYDLIKKSREQSELLNEYLEEN